MANPYAPPGESADDLWQERSNFAGTVLGSVAYGIQAAIFAKCLYHLTPWPKSRARKGDKNRSRSWFMLVYVVVLFAISTVEIGCNVKLNELMFIDNRAFPGGPVAWYAANFNVPVSTAANAAYITGNFLADALLLWRAYMLWDSFLVISFPFIVFLGSTAMSIMTLFQSSRPNANLWTKVTIQFSLPYWSISIALNTLLTLLLVSRLLYMSYNARKALSDDHGKPYISVAAMLLESAAPYAIVGLIYIITYARNSQVQNLVLPILSQVMCISPEVIILRVAMGSATESTSRESGRSTTLKFRSAPGLESSSQTTSKDVELGITGRGLVSGTTTLGSITVGSRPSSLKAGVDGVSDI
ncbi:hypothetical protein C8Q70DRAFT_953067 [Cubamyces menziesii]|nr:hypothetical protein C8Q70DRAFT_953067 [Cubamyces menziesii]